MASWSTFIFKSAGFIYAEFSESWLIGAVFFYWLSTFWLPPCSRDVILLHHGEIRVASFQVGSLSGFLLHFQVLSWKCSLSQLKCCIMAQKMWQFWLKQDYPWMSSCESHLNWQKWHLLDSWYFRNLIWSLRVEV